VSGEQLSGQTFTLQTWRLTIRLPELLSGVASGPIVHQVPSDPTVTIRNGTYTGIYNGNYYQDMFLGISYAQPPLGELRFNFPARLNTSWTGTRDTKEYSPQCVGYLSEFSPYKMSEDCLTINIVRPADISQGEDLPVAFWIHGGGLTNDGSSNVLYNLSNIVRKSVAIGKPMIGVSINYRLSSWGLMYNTELAKLGLSNLSLRDQRLAMHWVQENIAAFGGDPRKVTIWGVSAGAMSVSAHTLAFGGRENGLFRACILESGTSQYTKPNFTMLDAQYAALATNLSCPSPTDNNALACIRHAPFEALNAFFNGSMNSHAWIDGDFLPTYGSEMFRNGTFLRVPLLAGTNTDEMTGWTPYGINTDEDFLKQTSARDPIDEATKETLARLYPDIPSIGLPITYHGRPNSTIGLQFKRAATYTSDNVMHSQARLARKTRSNHNTPTFAYRFNVVYNSLPPWFGSMHALEFPLVFQNLGKFEDPADGQNPFEGMPKSFYDLADLMSRMWISFVHDMDPNGHGVAGTPQWPLYRDEGMGNGRNFVLDANVTGLGYAESDTWRAEAIQYLNDVAVSQYGR